MTVTWTYSSGKLTSVSNGLGRTLTLSYTGDRLSSVTDGNDRSVSFELDPDKNLVAFTDTEDNTISYQYSAPGLLSQIFLPANPTVAVMTNTYDSLNRVKTQSGSNTGTSEYFFAGSRSEEVDPLGNSHVMYNNELGSVVRSINALEQETSFEFDGLNRQTKVTLPEGNYTEMTYDDNNNVLTITNVAKPGSGLSNIVQTMEYDPD